jgi:hypothetical protein
MNWKELFIDITLSVIACGVIGLLFYFMLN